MIRIVALFGSIAGVIVTVPMLWTWLRLSADAPHPPGGLMLGYLTMVVALSAVFLGIKRYRDKVLGGVIRFLPALGVGLAISFVAGLFYVIGWEIVTAYGKFDFTAWYYHAMIEGARDQGPEALRQATAEAEDFKRLYTNPLTRMAFVFIEIFPVGVVISLISAAVLRNPRVLPARAPVG